MLWTVNNILWIINISTGIIIFLIAFLIRFYGLSNLIAGYNTASKEEKEKYNENLLVKYVSNMMIISAIILIIGGIPSMINHNYANLFFTGSWIIFTVFIFLMVIFMNLSKKIKNVDN